jgi:hypothetical protein
MKTIYILEADLEVFSDTTNIEIVGNFRLPRAVACEAIKSLGSSIILPMGFYMHKRLLESMFINQQKDSGGPHHVLECRQGENRKFPASRIFEKII